MRARLINPELLTVIPVRRDLSVEDSLGEEPYISIGRAAASFQILCQVDEFDRNRRKPGQGGAEVSARGQLSFLRSTCEAANWSPLDGDRITAVADRLGGSSRTVNWYIKGPHLLAKERARAKLIVCDFEDGGSNRTLTEGV